MGKMSRGFVEEIGFCGEESEVRPLAFGRRCKEVGTSCLAGGFVLCLRLCALSTMASRDGQTSFVRTAARLAGFGKRSCVGGRVRWLHCIQDCIGRLSDTVAVA